MFCSKCGKEISDDSKFCRFCGNQISGNQSINLEKLSAKDENLVEGQSSINIDKVQQPQDNKIRNFIYNSKIVSVAFVAIFIIAIFAATRNVRIIEDVKNGTLNNYNNKTISQAFENFFGKPTWGAYKKDGKTYVKFTGNCYFDGKEEEVEIDFLINGDSFRIDGLRAGNQENLLSEVKNLLNAVYE